MPTTTQSQSLPDAPASIDVEAICRVVHEALGAYADSSRPQDRTWRQAGPGQRAETRASVLAVLEGRAPDARALHRLWVDQRLARGWSLGSRDAGARTHPALVAYEELPAFEQRKDALVLAVVAALIPSGHDAHAFAHRSHRFGLCRACAYGHSLSCERVDGACPVRS